MRPPLLLFLCGLLLTGCATVEEGVADTVAGSATANLTGGQVVPGPGDPDGSGRAKITVVKGTNRLCYDFSLRGIARPTIIALRRGQPGANGPVVLSFNTPSSTDVKGCLTPPRALGDEIRRMPGSFHLQVQTGEFPDGAIRGQLAV